MQGAKTAPLDCPVYNPAFDVTPAKYITAIITEEGVCYPPFEQSLKEAVAKSEARTQKVPIYSAPSLPPCLGLLRSMCVC